MVDPRIARTKNSVLSAAARLMVDEAAPLTYTSLARESTVSRRTIYNYWPNLDAVVTDVLERKLAERTADLDGFPLVERLARYLGSVRTGLAEPVESVALLIAVDEASKSEEVSVLLHAIMQHRLTFFRAHVAPINSDQFAQLMGPIFYHQLVSRGPVPNRMLAAQVRFGLSILAEHIESEKRGSAEK